MGQIGASLVGSYDLRLVVLSIFIAISASYAALDLGGRVAAARGWLRSAWLAGGAAAMGLGIWSMHFTGMLAFTLPVPVAYHWPTVVLSLLAAILASAVALYVASRREMDRVQALTGGLLMGFGIAGMHYIGMAAMRMPAVCHYSPLLVSLSVLIAVIASLAALGFPFDYREDSRSTISAKVISATIMGAAISLMHYTGMMAARFFPSTILPDISHAVSVSGLGLSGIAIVTFVVQALAVLTSSVDRQLAAQAQELQTSGRFRQIADFLKDVLLLSNRDLSEVLFVNRAYEAIWGRTVESLYANPRSWLEGVHPDDRQQVEEALRTLVDGEPLDYLECRVVRADGTISWVRLRARPVLDFQGHPYRIVGSFHEFTKRKLAEEQVRQAENHLRLVLDTTPAMIHSGRPDGYLDYFNQRWLEYVGLSLDSLQGWGWTAVIHPGDVDRIVDKWRASLASGEPFEAVARSRRADGEYRWMLHRKVPMRDERGNIAKWYGSSIDIEDRKRAEEVLRESEQRFRQLVELLPVAVYVCDPSGIIQSYNNEARKLWGREPKVGDTAQRYCGSLRLYSLDGKLVSHQESMMAEVLRTGIEVRNLEIIIERPDGSRITVAVNIVPLRNDAGELVGAINCFQDITERKQAERQSQTLIDAIPQQIWSGPPDGTIDYCNERWRSETGLALEDVRDEGWLNIIHPDDRVRVLKAWRDSVTNGAPYEQEERHRRADGTYRWFLSRGVPMRDAEGRIVRWYGTNTDIEDRKRAEQELRQSEDRIRAILEFSPNWIFLKDTEGRYLLVNREIERVFGISQEQIKGKTDREIFPSEQAAEYRANDLKVLRAGLTMEFEEISDLEDGPHTSIVHKFPLFDTNGNIYATGGVATDITERKRAEESRRHSEEQRRIVLDTAPDAVISIDEDSQILFVNAATPRIFGYDSSELIGKPLTMLMPELMRETHLAGVQRYRTTGQPHMNWQGVELTGLRKNREEFPIEVSFGEVLKRGHHIFTGFIRDITDRKRAEEHLNRERTYLAMAQRIAQMGVWSWNPSSNDMYGSRELFHIFGIDPAKTRLTHEFFLQSIHPQDRSKYERGVSSAIIDRRNWELDYRIVLQDDSLKHIQGIGRPVFDKSGELIEFVGTSLDITDRKQAEEELRQLSGRLLRVQDEERRKIARDLHDSTGQNLVALATMLGQLRSSIPSGARKPRRLLSECKALAERCIREVRTLSYVLHPPLLDDAGLADAIRDYVKGFAKRSGIQVELEVPPRMGRLARDIELVVFRVVQESLTNIQRHSGSQFAKIRVHENSDLTLEISDLGHGLSSRAQGKNQLPQPEVGVGIPSMQERVKLVGGRLDIVSTSDGTSVLVTIPLGGDESEKTSHFDR